MKSFQTSCFLICSHNLSFLNLISFCNPFFDVCLFKKSFQLSFALFFHIIPHGPIKSPVFLFIIMFWGFFFWGRVMGCNDMYSCILMAHNNKKKNQIIYKWNVLSANRTFVGWPQWASLLPFSFQSIIINTNVLLQIYILSVVKRYVFIICLFSLSFSLLIFCFPLKAQQSLVLLLCILTFC